MYPAEFDLSEWNFPPPLDLDSLPDEPPPEADTCGGVTIGSDLGSIRFLGSDATDLGYAVCQDLASVHPGLVELARLGSTDFESLNATERVDALIAVDKQLAWLEARKQELLATIATKDSSDKHWCIEEIGAALGLSGAAARSRLANAEQLVVRLPETLSALSTGTISGAQATAITHASFVLSDELLPAFESRVLARADEQSLTAITRSAKRAALSLDPATAQQKRQRAVADRHVRISPSEDGMAWLLAFLPAADARVVYGRLDGAARAAAREEERTMDQLRADALVNGVLNGIGAELPSEQGRRPRINVTVSLNTLLGKDDEPGWLDGYGPIGADYARELAHDPTGTWRRLIADPVSGQLLDYGSTRYRPPRHLAEHVIARDGECTFPFCNHSARRSDLDHIEPYPNGSTSSGNLQPLHRRHHNAKTEAGWHARRDDKGDTHWTSPQGRYYRTGPPERWSKPHDPPPF
jgi:hypothetical protein